MIHYHGGPISPVEAAAGIWTGRHGFVSFAYPGQINIISEVCQSFALDNGAFSLWQSGKTVDYDSYGKWVMDWCKHPGFDFALIPDLIDGNEKDNMKLVRDWRFGEHIGVPVWHLHESLSYLKWLTQCFPRVAFGSSGNFSIIGTREWWERLRAMIELKNKGIGCVKLLWR